MREREEKARNMERALRAAGSRISSQRRAIIDYLASATSHPSARQIFHEVRKNHPNLSLATVYNTLGVLIRMSLIKVMQFDVTDNRYEPNVTPHINLICTSCGRIEDLEQGVPVQPEEIREKVGFEVLDSRLEYYGLCAKCKAVVKGYAE
ncbi:MAG TPA: transcriptional repressor [Syntrophobacteraceae bacterium]|nr:transcriptional repressor [Syntrophobacteraceae bacterium]